MYIWCVRIKAKKAYTVTGALDKMVLADTAPSIYFIYSIHMSIAIAHIIIDIL